METPNDIAKSQALAKFLFNLFLTHQALGMMLLMQEQEQARQSTD